MATIGARVLNVVHRLADAFNSRLLCLPKKYLSGPVVRSAGDWITRHYHIKANKDRQRPRLLILRNQMLPQDRKFKSSEIGMLDSTLETSGLADFETMTYDNDLSISPWGDLQLIRKCSEMSPDLVILSSWSSNPTHPSIEALRFIRQKLNIQTAAIWWDTCHAGFWPNTSDCLPEFDHHIVVDNPQCRCLGPMPPSFGRFLLLWPPQSEQLFCERGEPRDLLVSFVGQVGSYRAVRQEFIQYLTDKIANGLFHRTDVDGRMLHARYAEIMRTSKMCINFSHSVDAHQLKARVIETMQSGAMLLESENEQTKELFTPYEDYVPFFSKEDLVEKIYYFESHPTEMTRIAANGTRKAKSFYSGDMFWHKVLQRAGL